MTTVEKATAIQTAVHNRVNKEFWVPAVGNGQIAVFLDELLSHPDLMRDIAVILGKSLPVTIPAPEVKK